MKKRQKFVAGLLTLLFFVQILPVTGDIATVSAATSLPSGTVIYYEDFNYANNSTKSSVLNTLGWKTSTELRANQTNYSIVDGRLLCDSISTGATGDSYVTVLDNAAMSEVQNGDYSIAYKLTYVEADSYTRYGCLIYNYNGYKTYNSVHVRIAGYGNNQARNAAKWKDYDSSSSSYYMKATGTSSISYKLYGVQAASANASSTTAYPFVGKELSVRIAVDIDTGTTVYINGTKVSVPTSTYKDVFEAAQEYADAIALKTSAGVKLYMDDLTVYTGLGAVPTVKKSDVTYKLPTSNEDKNAIRVMSYNTLYSDQSKDVFGNGITRTYHMYNVVSGYHPDIVGMQERAAANMTGVTSLLESDAGYSVANEYRTDTSVSSVVSYVPILYNTKRFSLVANDSSNNNNAHGALLFDKSYNIKDMTASQIASYAGTKGLAWAVLKDKKTGGYVLALNAHFALNHSNYTGYSDEEAIEARLSNAAQALEKMEEIYDVFGVIPTVFTGDFNMRRYDPAYKAITETLESSIYGNENFVKYEYSMNKITGADFTRAPNTPIDHIFYNDQALTPTDYYVGNKADETMIASDHLPVIATFSYNKILAPTPSHHTDIYSTDQYVSYEGEGDIYYTTDGTDPRYSETRKLYGGAVSVTEDTVLKSCCKLNGVYSNVNRITLFFNTPLYITEVIKNANGTDHTEGFEIINASNVEVDLSDFSIWSYADANESACLSVANATVVNHMPMAEIDGAYVLPAGEIGFCPIVTGDVYLYKDNISATESAYLVTLNEDGTKVTYHRDRYAAAIKYDGAGDISADRIFPIDRTARSIGYTDSGTLVKRHDYYHSTAGSANNTTRSFNMTNSAYSRLYITIETAPDVSKALCICNQDSTGGGITTATDSAGTATTTVAVGAFNYLPTTAKLMTTAEFTKNSYTIGSLTQAQKTALSTVTAKKDKVASNAITNAAEFAAMSSDGSYYLACDITLSSTYKTVFTGVLDGRGHKVTTSVPMFTDMSGTVRNLTVEGNITVSSGYNGAVSTQVTGRARFENVTVNANLSGGTTTGGLVGYGVSGCYVTAIHCINRGNHSGTEQVGGLIGYVQGITLTVDECINYGKITSTSYGAGIVARFGKNAATMSYRCNITNCVNYGEVVTSGLRSGGILGYSVGRITISGCTNHGYIHYSGSPAEFNAGGIYAEGGSTYLSGSTETNTKNSVEISDCFNYGKVAATCSAGGIVGRMPAPAPVSGYYYKIERCGNAGEINTADGGAARNTKGSGGIVGYFYGGTKNVISRCYNVGKITVSSTDTSKTARACGIASYFSSSAIYFEDCYNAGTVTASGKAVAYQLYYNNNATGSSATYTKNNHALAVSGATYEKNGSQSASYKTFTAAELKDGTLRDRINSAAVSTVYFQNVGVENYPVHREYEGFKLWGIVLKDSATYRENGSFVYRVELGTARADFTERFLSPVKVLSGTTELTCNATLKTGDTVTSFDGGETMTVAVIGDANGDGTVTTTDYACLKVYLGSGTGLNELMGYALDVNCDEVVSTSDCLSIVSAITG